MTTFGLIFLAELGDKTQLATFLLVAQNKSALAVFLGASSAMVLASLMAVLAGGAISKIIPANYIQNGAGVLFIVMGVLLLSGKV
ncbi:MAG: TMEM165/GDT1 family protein [bacterium]|nr:TMEM165/GDT1 family protein [bacterium]